MTSLRNVRLSGLMLIMALFMMSLLYWPSSAAASITAPSVATDSATSIGDDYTTLKGEIDSGGDSDITSYGFYYGTSTATSSKVSIGSSIDKNESFSYKLSNLNTGTTYYFKAYAANDNGTSYGSTLSFTTKAAHNPLNANANATFIIGSQYYQVNGVNRITEVAPYIKDGRTLLPILEFADSLGMTDADVVWDEASQTITLTKGAKVVQLTIGSHTISVNNMDISMDVAPEISNGRRCLPLRWVAELLGETVNWNAVTSTVTIQ